MANHKQALKRIRQTATATERNRAARTAMRTAVKNFEKAAEAGNKEEMATTFKAAMASLHKSVSKGIIKKQTASRKISRLSACIKRAGA